MSAKNQVELEPGPWSECAGKFRSTMYHLSTLWAKNDTTVAPLPKSLNSIAGTV